MNNEVDRYNFDDLEDGFNLDEIGTRHFEYFENGNEEPMEINFDEGSY